MLEDLIVRYRLKNREIFLVAFLYGLFPITFLTRNLFNPDIYWGIMILGVNLGTLIIIGILAWGVVQGMVTLYLANRLSPRDWDHPRMGKVGWSLAIIYQLGMMIIAYFNPNAPRGTLMGHVVFGVLVIFSTTLLVRTLRTPRPPIGSFEPSRVMDFLAFGSVFLFLVLGTFFISGSTIVTSQPLNLVAVKIENVWVVVCGIIFFLYRWRKGSDIQV